MNSTIDYRAVISDWRNKSQRVINRVRADNPGTGHDELKKLFFAAYPFGPRANYPYRVWCDEIEKALRDMGVGQFKTGDGGGDACDG